MENNIGEARRYYALVNLDGEKYTQEDAARDFGVSLGTYRNCEQGVNKGLSGKQLRMIADKYGTTVDYLLKLTDKPERTTYSFITYPSDAEPHESLPDGLTTDEREILSLYRSLDETSRQMALRAIRGMASVVSQGKNQEGEVSAQA